MLIAALKNQDRNINCLCEDEITSSVFGPLSFMQVEDVWALFNAWLPIPDELLPGTQPTKVSFAFWPNLLKDIGGLIEPDLVCRFKNDKDEHLLTIMIEVKWNAGSGDNQLIKQWGALPDMEKEKAIHVYLVKKTAAGKKEIEKSLATEVFFLKKQWRERLFCVGWRSLIETIKFKRPRSISPAMGRWSDAVEAFLRKLGLTAFSGFDWLEKTKPIIVPETEAFWKPIPWFSGLEKIEVPTVQGEDLFWQA